MMELILHTPRTRRTGSLAAWQRGAAGLLVLSAVSNAAYASALLDARARLSSEAEAHRVQLEQAEYVRDRALEKLGAMVLQAERDRQARAEQAAAFEDADVWTYVGECTVTAYCPCETCCGRWADGLTASGLPAGPGIVAVDPAVIPLGSTVVIDGQKYLAADTGVTGNRVDVYLPEHRDTVAFGVRQAEVWVENQ